MKINPDIKAQVLNYLNWASERGLSVPLIRPSQGKESLAPSIEKVDSETELTPIETSTKKLLLVTRELNEQEKALIKRILEAIDLDDESVAWLSDPAKFSSQSQTLSFVLVLGSAGAEIWEAIFPYNHLALNQFSPIKENTAYTLLISHPAEMIADPNLKREVWNALKSFKVLIQKGDPTPV